MRLEVLFQALEIDVAESTGDEHAQELSRVARNIVFLAESEKDGLRARPNDADGNIKEAENDESALENDSQIMLVLAAGETRTC